MKGFCVHTVGDVSRRNVAGYGAPLETHWLRKRHITVHPMNWGLTKFQNDYISAGETFCPKTNVLFEPEETNLAVQPLSDLSFRDSLDLELLWERAFIFDGHLHVWLSQFTSAACSASRWHHFSCLTTFVKETVADRYPEVIQKWYQAHTC